MPPRRRQNICYRNQSDQLNGVSAIFRTWKTRHCYKDVRSRYRINDITAKTAQLFWVEMDMLTSAGAQETCEGLGSSGDHGTLMIPDASLLHSQQLRQCGTQARTEKWTHQRTGEKQTCARMWGLDKGGPVSSEEMVVLPINGTG